MKTHTIQNFKVSIINANITRGNGYGQYRISVDIKYNGVNKTLSIHSTDSVLFDGCNDCENTLDFLMENAKCRIESAIDDHLAEVN